MRLVLYNIRYGTGTGWEYHFPFPFSGCLRKTGDRFLDISRFVSGLKPDIVGLVETDCGSYRQNGVCQAELMAAGLNASSVFACKYDRDSIASKAPLLKSQGNAVVTHLPIISTREHYLSRGVKRTLLEVEFRDFTLFLAHLSIGYRARRIQIGELAERLRQAGKPVILAGDGNIYAGEKELMPLFKRGLFRNANYGNTPTYPSRFPRLALDFILYSGGINMKGFQAPRVRYSDHLPLVFDFFVPGRRGEALAS